MPKRAARTAAGSSLAWVAARSFGVVGALAAAILLTQAQVPSLYVQASTGALIIVAAVLTTIASRRSRFVRTRTGGFADMICGRRH